MPCVVIVRLRNKSLANPDADPGSVSYMCVYIYKHRCCRHDPKQTNSGGAGRGLALYMYLSLYLYIYIYYVYIYVYLSIYVYIHIERERAREIDIDVRIVTNQTCSCGPCCYAKWVQASEVAPPLRSSGCLIAIIIAIAIINSYYYSNSYC